MALDKRFNVTLSLDVKELAEDGSQTDFFAAAVDYSNMSYAGIVGIEQLLMALLKKLSDVGLKKAVSSGASLDTLEAMGIELPSPKGR